VLEVERPRRSTNDIASMSDFASFAAKFQYSIIIVSVKNLVITDLEKNVIDDFTPERYVYPSS
jgi:hypothetical protein